MLLNLIFQSAEVRQPATGVRYARFHDEDMMRGDNVETLFNNH